MTDERRPQSSSLKSQADSSPKPQVSSLTGRIIFEGSASGCVLKSDVPMGFFGHLDPETGVYREQGHPLDGVSIKGRVLVFPRGKGSTVGSYILYGLKKAGNAPAAMVMTECDTIVAVGAIIGEIPTIDGVELSGLESGQLVRIDGACLEIGHTPTA